MPSTARSSARPTRFEVDGFLRVRRLLTPGEVADLRRLYERTLGRAGAGAGDRMRWLGRPEDLEQALDGHGCRAAAVNAVAGVIGPGEHVRGTGLRIFDKPPGSAAPTPWHQDRAFRTEAEGRSISCWIALDDTGPDNGCLVYSPGSARLGLVPHRALCEVGGVAILQAAEPRSTVAVPLRAGDALLHGDLTLHYSGPNRSDRPRRALVVKCEIGEGAVG